LDKSEETVDKWDGTLVESEPSVPCSPLLAEATSNKLECLHLMRAQNIVATTGFERHPASSIKLLAIVAEIDTKEVSLFLEVS
jgi:hypothetical protein